MIDARYGVINHFEAELAKQGDSARQAVSPHSREEQRKRLLARLGEPEKHWKFSSGDITERSLWPDYQNAYSAALGRCSTAGVPWYVVPANRKWYRNWAVSQLLIETMEEMKLTYPNPHLDVRAPKKSLLAVA